MGRQRLSSFSEPQVRCQTGTAALKDELREFGIAGFVAHEDIQPTREWHDEIVNALASMDGLAALMTEDFDTSDWTDQEIGFAFAREVPIIAVRIGEKGVYPYGFIGRFQALSRSRETCTEAIVKILIKEERMFNAYVDALRNCGSFDEGNRLSKALPGIQALSDQQIDALVAVFNENPQLQGSYGFNGASRLEYGPGLTHYLNQLGLRQFQRTAEWLIEPVG